MSLEDSRTLTGWGVVRWEPWHFIGIFAEKGEAEARARSQGPDYIVRYGEHEEGTEDFVWSDRNNPDVERI